MMGEPMKTRLLLKVRDAILAEPTKFDMSEWYQKDMESPCGTAACIAGHIIVQGKKLERVSQLNDAGWISGEAKNLAGLTFLEKGILFYTNNWPARFRNRYRRHELKRNRALMAKAAADRIDHFISTKGKE